MCVLVEERGVCTITGEGTRKSAAGGRTHVGAVGEELSAEEPVSEEQGGHHHAQVEQLAEEEPVRPPLVAVHGTLHILGQGIITWGEQRKDPVKLLPSGCTRIS